MDQRKESPSPERPGLRLSLRIRALVTMGLLATFSGLVVWSTLISYFKDDKATYIKDSALDVANNKALTVNLLLLRHLEALRRIEAQLLSHPQPREVLRDGLRTSPETVFLALYDTAGDVVEGFARHDLLAGSGIDSGTFQAARRQTTVSLRYLALHGLLVSNTTNRHELPTFTMTIPIQGVEGGPAMLRAELRSEQLLQALELTSGFEVSIVDRLGDIFAHTDVDRMSPDARVAGADLLGDELLSALDQRSAGAGQFADPDGAIYLAAHASIELGGLDVVVRRPLADAYLAADRLRERSLRAALGIIALTAVIAVLASRVLTRRLADLAESARRLRAGDFEIRIASTSNDEIGDVALSLDQAALGLKQRDEQLHETHSQLLQSEKLSSFGRFSAGIVHEVKNPLSTIGMAVDMAKERIGDRKALERYLGMIAQEVKRSSEILQSMLGFTRSDDEIFEPVALNGLIEELSQIMAPQLRKSEVKLEHRLDAKPDVIRGDRTGLTQVLMNLVLNAVDAMKLTEVKGVTITTRTEAEQLVVVSVADTGPGIPDQVRNKLFDPFFTTKPKGEGTGLGLYVTHSIIDKHGGTVKVSNQESGGAVFQLRFPALDETAVPEDEEKLAEDSVTPA